MRVNEGDEWTDVDLSKRQRRIERSDWKGHVTVTKGAKTESSGDSALARAFATQTQRLVTNLTEGLHPRSRTQALSTAAGFTERVPVRFLKRATTLVRRASWHATMRSRSTTIATQRLIGIRFA